MCCKSEKQKTAPELFPTHSNLLVWASLFRIQDKILRKNLPPYRTPCIVLVPFTRFSLWASNIWRFGYNHFDVRAGTGDGHGPVIGPHLDHPHRKIGTSGYLPSLFVQETPIPGT
jgi:hypothetical protein